MARKLADRLKDFGVEMEVGEFQELLIDTAHRIAPAWNDEKLTHNPDVALRYCGEIRSQTAAPGLPDEVILRALSALRKRAVCMG
jgi:hypothetical protein